MRGTDRLAPGRLYISIYLYVYRERNSNAESPGSLDPCSCESLHASLALVPPSIKIQTAPTHLHLCFGDGVVVSRRPGHGFSSLYIGRIGGRADVHIQLSIVNNNNRCCNKQPRSKLLTTYTRHEE